MRIVLLGAALSALALGAVGAEKAAQGAPVDPLEPPQKLLSDPFAPHEDTLATDEGGMMRTNFGELPQGFHILGIVMGDGAAAALLRLGDGSDPVIVHENDVVMINRNDTAGGRGQNPRRRAASARPSASGGEKTLDEQLEEYVYYLHIKRITAGAIEVYRNKKRPDDSIILNW